MKPLSERWRFFPILFISVIFICSSLVILPAISTSSGEAVAQIPDNGPIQYNTVQTRYYKSSIDGTILPCSVYVPNSANRLGLWIELHAFGGPAPVQQIPGSDQTAWAYQRGMAILNPQGRNYRGMYVDSRNMTNPVSGVAEPMILDELKSSKAGWVPVPGDGGDWDLAGSGEDTYYQQSNANPGWKVNDRNGSNGRNYAVSVDLRQDSGGTTSGVGIIFRKNGNGDMYRVALVNGVEGGGRELLLSKKIGANWETLSKMTLAWSDDVWYNLEVNMFEEYIEVQVDHTIVPLDYEGKDPSFGVWCNDSSIDSGGAGLASDGGVHHFRNFRVQNEFLYGESDTLDCIRQFMEELSITKNYRIDPSRIYLSGYSMGGVGTWHLGLQHPDLFAALHPGCGATDVSQSTEWIKTQFPDGEDAEYLAQTDPTTFSALYPELDPATFDADDYTQEQDGGIGESMKALLCGEPSQYSQLIDSAMHENSARYILENAYLSPIRIEHSSFDSLLPSTLDPMHIWWNKWTGQGTETELVAVNTGAVSSWAQEQGVWQQWEDLSDNTPPLTRCEQETSGYSEAGEPPSGAIWDNWDYTVHGIYPNYSSPPAKNGSHGNLLIDPAFNDTLFCGKKATFFQRATADYGALRLNPPEVVYKSFDAQHDSAWWLDMEVAYPDQDDPGIARVVNGQRIDEVRDGATPFNGADVHVKNVETTRLDLMRMGVTTSSGQITIHLDNDTAPEADPENPVVDSWNKTDLELVAQWYPYPGPSSYYTVTRNGQPQDYSTSGSVMTLTDIPTDTASTITITANQTFSNLLQNPSFEDYFIFWIWYSLYNWHYENISDGQAIFEHNGQPELADDANNPIWAHTGTKSVRIKDGFATTWPFMSSWISDAVSVTQGVSYTANAFTKTNVLYSNSKVVENGKYSDAWTSNAGVGICWFNDNMDVLGFSPSVGTNGTNDWMPLEVTAQAVPGATKAKVYIFTVNPDDDGGSGSAWFDDVSLRLTNP